MALPTFHHTASLCDTTTFFINRHLTCGPFFRMPRVAQRLARQDRRKTGRENPPDLFIISIVFARRTCVIPGKG